MVSPDDFYVLLTKYTNDQCTEEEEKLLFQLIESGSYSEILSSHFDDSLLSENRGAAKISPIRAEEMMKRIFSSEKQTIHLISGNKKRASNYKYWWAAAAAIVILFFTAYFYEMNSSAAFSINEVASLQKDPQLMENKTGRPLTFMLEDGSEIVLEAGASLTYPHHFLSDKREVYLEGEAFFNIEKNPDRPFFVYHNNLVTHVLGTSFNIKTNPETDEVEIDVITGRVQVNAWDRKNPGSAKDEPNGVILTPNQKTVYSSKRNQFVTSLVDIPLPVLQEDSLLVTAGPELLIYENASLPNVLDVLETIYNVEILMENDKLNNCFFTGDLSDPNLFVNLDLISTVINATYEVKGTNILIKGRGCVNR